MRAKTKNGTDDILVIGLGNPGRAYKRTYHNAGFLAIDYLKEKLSAGPWRNHASGQFLWARAGRFALVKPLVFMNESGSAALLAARFFRIRPASTIVVHDDSDLAIGTYKYSTDRGAGGHKGIESVIASFKTKAFGRIRIGIRPRREGRRRKAGAFVLKKMTAEDYGGLEVAFKEVMENVMVNSPDDFPAFKTSGSLTSPN